MKDRKLAMRYARALLSVLEDPAAREKTDAFLTGLGTTIDSAHDLRRAMLDPAVPRAVRRKILSRLAEQRGLPAVVGRFLGALVDNNRLAVLPTVAAVFHEERERQMGVVAAELTTATPLGPEMQARARAAMERLTGNPVRLTCRVEPALIGGGVARIGSTLYDGSLRTQLDRLRRRMVAG
jgi:F-type H+-transporting ATPase subunit delta